MTKGSGKLPEASDQSVKRTSRIAVNGVLNLKPGGVYMSSEVGPGWQNLLLPPITRLVGGKRVIFPIPEDKPGFFAQMHELARAGRFRPVIDRTYRFDSIREAYAYVASGRKTGCVILDVGWRRTI